ncbi:acyl-CoA N-acyltransferase [Stachybotrys elegans]|uniref:Acyl-CoA N-acyltransferase n=1 Tax=Stachybotrys elegans TaxID=80388 RepID=A0A8K0SFF0_9HYPO|nr:acyl-CoA N-acyltransferase [Stachybotrys elegans]
MAPQIVHLPDGQTFTVVPVFAGVRFKSHELNTHPTAWPVGWTVVLHTEGDELESAADGGRELTADGNGSEHMKSIHPFAEPTLQNDTLFISSISNPPSSEFKPPASPTRQIAMMLWITLYWYFHQPAPSPYLTTSASANTPENARPKAEWKINIKRGGILRSRHLIPKLERMGLIASADTAVGTDADDNGDAWAQMFVSRHMFWQIPARLFLFTLQPNKALSSFPGSPAGSRPTSPVFSEPQPHSHHRQNHSHSSLAPPSDGEQNAPLSPSTIVTTSSFPIGPFTSTSHLPTYYPPAPLRYVMTNGVRHPLRPKPPRMGETFYCRFVPSVGRYLSLRVASSSPSPVSYLGPVGPKEAEHQHLTALSDAALLQKWLSSPRVKAFWGGYTEDFLTNALHSKHSFPVIGLWDGVPFGYFEIYWVKEDILGRHLGSEADDWDRGLHVLVGEEWARGRVPCWLTCLMHWCFCADNRTMNICLEPRVDNAIFLEHLDRAGFAKEKQVSFPHKLAWYVKYRRETWEGPAL